MSDHTTTQSPAAGLFRVDVEGVRVQARARDLTRTRGALADAFASIATVLVEAEHWLRGMRLTRTRSARAESFGQAQTVVVQLSRLCCEAMAQRDSCPHCGSTYARCHVASKLTGLVRCCAQCMHNPTPFREGP